MRELSDYTMIMRLKNVSINFIFLTELTSKISSFNHFGFQNKKKCQVEI
jgi:hypothetical protein